MALKSPPFFRRGPVPTQWKMDFCVPPLQQDYQIALRPHPSLDPVFGSRSRFDFPSSAVRIFFTFQRPPPTLSDDQYPHLFSTCSLVPPPKTFPHPWSFQQRRPPGSLAGVSMEDFDPISFPLSSARKTICLHSVRFLAHLGHFSFSLRLGSALSTFCTHFLWSCNRSSDRFWCLFSSARRASSKKVLQEEVWSRAIVFSGPNEKPEAVLPTL